MRGIEPVSITRHVLMNEPANSRFSTSGWLKSDP